MDAAGQSQPAAQEDGTALLAEFLSNPDHALRLEAARALAKLGPAAAVAVPALTTALKERNLKLRLVAATALGGIGAAAEPAIPALAVAVTGTHVILARLAAQALSRIGRPAVPALVDLLQSADPFVRREAAWALGEMGPAVGNLTATAVPPLPPASLTDTTPDRRHAITPVVCLTRQEQPLTPTRQEQAITPVLDLKRDQIVKEWQPGTAARPRVAISDPVQALTAALSDIDGKVRTAAERALARIRAQK